MNWLEADAPSPKARGRRLVEVAKDAVVTLLIDVLIVFVLIVLVWAVVWVGVDVWTSITTRSWDAFKNLSVEILTVFVFIELFHSLTEYARYKRLRVTTLVDASLAFVLREVWIGMYGGDIGWQKMIALAAMVLALGGVRTLAVVFSPSERRADMAEA